MSRAFPQRLCISSVFLVGRLYSGILCLIGWKRNDSRFSSFQHCYNTHTSTYFTKLKIAICQFQPLSDPRKGFFSWASTSPTLMYRWNSQSNFHRTTPLLGIPLAGLFSIAHLLDPLVRPLATNHESEKTQVYIEAKSMHSSSLSWFVFTLLNQSGSFPKRMLSVHYGSAIHKLSTSLLSNRELFIGKPQEAIGSSRASSGSQANIEEKRLPAHEYLLPVFPEYHFLYKPFPFHHATLLKALLCIRALLWHHLRCYGHFRFKIILYPSVIGAVLINVQ